MGKVVRGGTIERPTEQVTRNVYQNKKRLAGYAKRVLVCTLRVTSAEGRRWQFRPANSMVAGAGRFLSLRDYFTGRVNFRASSPALPAPASQATVWSSTRVGFSQRPTLVPLGRLTTPGHHTGCNIWIFGLPAWTTRLHGSCVVLTHSPPRLAGASPVATAISWALLSGPERNQQNFKI